MNEFRASYIGTFEHSFDAKGRITVPTDWRTPAHDEFLFVFPSDQNVLRVYPASWLSRLQQQVAGLKFNDPQRLQLNRLAEIGQPAKPDQQGRIMIKEKFRQHAEVVRKAVLVGRMDHFEVRSEERHQAQGGGAVFFESVAENLGI